MTTVKKQEKWRKTIIQSRLLVIVLLFAMLAMITGCGNSDDTLVGTWGFIGTAGSERQEPAERLVFNSDGTGRMFGINFTWSSSGSSVTILLKEGEEELEMVMTYKITEKGKTLELSGYNEDYLFGGEKMFFGKVDTL